MELFDTNMLMIPCVCLTCTYRTPRLRYDDASARLRQHEVVHLAAKQKPEVPQPPALSQLGLGCMMENCSYVTAKVSDRTARVLNRKDDSWPGQFQRHVQE